MTLKPEEKLVLSAVNVTPEKDEIEYINNLVLQIEDWDYLTILAIERQAGPLLYKKLNLISNKDQIPEKVRNQLNQSWLKTLSRSMVLIDHFSKVMDAFKSADIQVICLKGIFLSEWLYKEVGLRQFSDIDLLVREEDGQKALSILKRLGYENREIILPESMKMYVESQHYSPMFKDGVSFEIHTKINVKLDPYNVDITELWESATLVKIHGVETYSFNLEYLLLHLCIHLDKHVASGKIQFTCLYDIVNLLNQFCNKIDWDTFNSICIKSNTLKHTYKYLILSNKYFKAKLPLNIINDFGYCLNKADERIFLEFLISGKVKLNYASSIVGSVGNIEGVMGRIYYIRQMLFPPIVFMMQRYKLKNKYYLFAFYPYRFCFGFLQGLFAFYNLLRRKFL